LLAWILEGFVKIESLQIVASKTKCKQRLKLQYLHETNKEGILDCLQFLKERGSKVEDEVDTSPLNDDVSRCLYECVFSRPSEGEEEYDRTGYIEREKQNKR